MSIEQVHAAIRAGMEIGDSLPGNVVACAGIGGQTVLDVQVGVEGTPAAITLVRGSGNDQLDQLARDAVQGWKFRPATRAGQPVAQNIQVPVSFTPPAVRPDACFAIDAGRAPAD